MILHQFPAVTSSYPVFRSAEEERPWSCRKTFYHLENLDQVCCIPTFFERPQTQLTNPFVIWQASEMWKQTCEAMLYSFHVSLSFLSFLFSFKNFVPVTVKNRVRVRESSRARARVRARVRVRVRVQGSGFIFGTGNLNDIR